jgi:hypothetical protein
MEMKSQLRFSSTYLLQKSLLIIFLCIGISQTMYSQEVVTNETIIQMKELGFDDDTIIEKINSSDTKLDASIAALTKLKKAGISSKVIALVLKKEKYNSKSKTGIYYIVDGKKKLIQPSVFSGTNSNSAAQRLVSGLINSKVKAQLPKASSNNVIRNRNPEFEFVFNPVTTETDNLQNLQGKDNVGLLNWWFRVASNPNEFVLVQFKVKKRKNLREVVIGKQSSVSSSSGIDPKKAIAFSIEEIQANKFKVVASNLEPGEYCFIYQGQTPQGRSNQSVFDFSIQ